jgi:hypothetical protein
MADRKPIPKTQREISISQQEPYQQGGPDFSPPGNPNKDGGLNRSEQLSFKGDDTKPFTLGIQDIDEAIYYYFTEVIKPFVIQNGQRIAVPVVYGNPEKWKMVQKDGYYRDKNGKIMSPLLVFKRDDLTKVRNIGNKLDANHPNLYSSFIKNYSSKNAYDNFSVLNNRVPQKQQYAIVIPDYVTIKYSCVIYTYYVEQMNKIVEAINYASDSYWGDPARFKFRAMIDSFATTIEVNDGQDRAIKSNFDIKLNGYLIPDVIQKDVNAVKKLSNTTSISIFTEGTTNLDQ